MARPDASDAMKSPRDFAEVASLSRLAHQNARTAATPTARANRSRPHARPNARTAATPTARANRSRPHVRLNARTAATPTALASPKATTAPPWAMNHARNRWPKNASTARRMPSASKVAG